MAQFTNQASMTYNGITVNSNIVTGNITGAIEAYKTAVEGGYAQGDVITYAISIRNTGATEYTGLSISDDLGAYPFGTAGGTVTPLTFIPNSVRYLIDGVPQVALPTVTAGPPLVFSGINVPAGQDAVIIYQARVNEFANPTAGTTIQNSASITGGGLVDAVTALFSLATRDEPELSIIKELSPTNVVENGQITYTFTILNRGNAEADAAANIVISDLFTPPLDAPLTVTLNGAPLDQAGNYTYTAGQFTTTAGIITVPAATSTQNPADGSWTVTPGTAILTVTGTV